MPEEKNAGDSHTQCCPFCALWTAFKRSDAATHMRGVERESLLLARSLLDTCIRATEEQIKARTDRIGRE